MKATLITQRILKGDSFPFITNYITDIPIETDYEEVEDRVLQLCAEQLTELQPDIDVSLERNGMMGYWCFTVATKLENKKFAVEMWEESPAEKQNRLRKIAVNWFSKLGIEEFGTSWDITDVQERDHGNTVRITLVDEISQQPVVEVLKKSAKGWLWVRE